jgi:hypothetical protein
LARRSQTPKLKIVWQRYLSFQLLSADLQSCIELVELAGSSSVFPLTQFWHAPKPQWTGTAIHRWHRAQSILCKHGGFMRFILKIKGHGRHFATS